jgi:NIPSNAP
MRNVARARNAARALILVAIENARGRHREDWMFVEQRLYTCAPGNSGEFLRLYEAQGHEPQTRYQGPPIGYYISEIGPLNQITTLWAYASLDERVERRRGLFEDPAWIAYLNKARPLLTAQETRILTPAPFFKERLATIAALGRTT